MRPLHTAYGSANGMVGVGLESWGLPLSRRRTRSAEGATQMKLHFSLAITVAAIPVWCVGWPSVAFARGIEATGGWSRPIGADDLIAGAGTDLVSVYESLANATLIGIDAAGRKQDWRVDVRRSTSVWDSSLALYVRRTGAGTGSGSVTGGTAYQLVTDTDTPFFSGREDRQAIPVQYRLGGVSIQLTPNTYSATVVFSVTFL